MHFAGPRRGQPTSALATFGGVVKRRPRYTLAHTEMSKLPGWPACVASAVIGALATWAVLGWSGPPAPVDGPENERAEPAASSTDTWGLWEITVHLRAAPWRIDGLVTLRRSGEAVGDLLHLGTGPLRPSMRLTRGAPEGSLLRFVAVDGNERWTLAGRIQADTFEGAAQRTKGGDRTPGWFTAQRVRTPLFSAPSPRPARTEPTRGVDLLLLERLVAAAERAGSGSLVVLKDGAPVADRRFDRGTDRFSVQSVTKAIASLAIPLLVEDGLVSGVDDPVAKYIPTFDTPERAGITLRHLLTHTSGLGTVDTEELNTARDLDALVCRAPVVAPPGTRPSYSNSAFQILAAVVKRACGEDVADYLGRRLFAPLGVRTASWSRDGAGRTRVYGGLTIDPLELATIGQLVCDCGVLHGAKLLPPDWCKSLLVPGVPGASDASLGWWVRFDDVAPVVQTEASLHRFRGAGFRPAERLAPLTGRAFGCAWDYHRAAGELLSADDVAYAAFAQALPSARPYESDAPPLGCFHSGSGGQYLLVYPSARLVVVRTVDIRSGDDDGQPARFSEIQVLADELARLR